MNECLEKVLLDAAGYDPAVIDAISNASTVKQLEEIKAAKELQVRQQMLQAQALNTHIVTLTVNDGRTKAVKLAAILARDLEGKGSGKNIDFLQKTINHQAQGMFFEGMEGMKATAMNTLKSLFRDDFEMGNKIVKSLFGETEGIHPQIKKMADSWKQTAEYLRQRFNEAGGDIKKRADWNLPQKHQRARVAKATREEWVDFTIDKIKHEGFTDEAGNQLNRAKIKEILGEIYESIRTDGLNKMGKDDYGKAHGVKLANRHQESRVLDFKSADDWLEYQASFGDKDVYGTMIEHIQNMSHEIAMLEMMGTNPKANFRYLLDMVKQEGAGEGKNTMYLEGLWRTVSGESETSASPRMADANSSFRNWLVASQLGSAMLSAVSDPVFSAMARSFNGLERKHGLRTMLKLAADDQKLAARMGLGLEIWQNTLNNRYSEVSGSNMTRKLSDFTMRASYLSTFTDAGRKTFGMEFMANLADIRGLSMDNLAKGKSKQERGLYQAMKRYDITPDEWDKIRNSEVVDHKGVQYLSADNLQKLEGMTRKEKDDLTAKLLNMVLTETDYAVPSPDARTRVISTGLGQKAGTYSGEAMRYLTQYKSFPITVMMQQFYRTFHQKGAVNNAVYGAQTLVMTTMAGYAAMQLKEMAKGKEPIQTMDASVVFAAAMQGGGLGILGDFFLSNQNRFGNGLLASMMGAGAGFVEDAHRLTQGNAMAAITDGESRFARDMVDFVGRYTPASSLWYTRVAFERIVLDQLELLADETATRKSWRRTARKAKKEKNQGYWWKHGEMAPEL
jgi:hypothetical protein